MFKFINNINKKSFDKKTLFMLVTIFCAVFFCCISVAYAFYSNNLSFPILANKVGDFDSKGDISAIVYNQINDANDNPIYRISYGIPTIGYEMDHVDCTIPCTDNQTDDCHYTYDINNNTMSVSSKEKVSCKFYFNKTTNSDVNVYIMLEDNSGSNVYNSKKYIESESIPAYGYEYNNYSCANSSEVTYGKVLKTFKVSTNNKDKCYVYFDKTNSANVKVNVFTQTEVGSTNYQESDTIPINKAYIKSTNPNYVSACYDESGNITNDEITYSGGYVTVSTTDKKTCNIYLDLYDGAPLIEEIESTSTATSIATSVLATPGKDPISCYKFKINGVNDWSECQVSPTYTFNNLNSCTYYQVLVNVVDAKGIEVGYIKTFKTNC